MAVQYGSGPFSHEIGHYWGVFLDRSFGFGVGKAYNNPVHWGYAGVSGMLGGFDPATLVCETPLGAAPADCEPTAEARYRYVVGSFSPGANTLPYAPLELYLMGLASADEVSAEIPMLEDAEDVPASFDPETRTEVVDAAGVTSVTMSDIMARHGVVTELAENERHFASAFVVVSAEPASDEVLAEVALRAAAFGDRGVHPITESFASDTGARATLDTELGPRRAVSNPAPAPRPAFTCDVTGQDCDDGLACHASYCALPGAADVNEPCQLVSDCIAGSRCVYVGDPSVGYCAQYCDRDDAGSPLGCASLCTSTITMVDENGEPQWTVCRPE
jgi:hypothetical protein